jgi:hypothetical protein
MFCTGGMWLVFELGWMENVVAGPWFVLLVLAVGAIPACRVGRWIPRFVVGGRGAGRLLRAEADEELLREANAAGLLAGVGLLVLGLSTASWYNHEHARAGSDVQATVLERKYEESSPRSAEEWRLIVELNWKREDVLVSRREWERSPPGTRVSMRVLNGALGFPVVCSARLRGRCDGETIALVTAP